MTKLAIDVVLLPPNDVMGKATEINQKLDTRKIDFTQKDFLPHITLLMGCMDAGDVDRIKNVLQEVANKYLPLPLTIKKIAVKGSGEQAVASFDIEKTETLQHLHEQLANKLKPYLTYDAFESMFYRPDEVQENAVNYVANFMKEASGEKYWPHITLGHGDHPETKLDSEFTATRLALCQLGKHCTCRRILAEIALH